MINSISNKKQRKSRAIVGLAAIAALSVMLALPFTSTPAPAAPPSNAGREHSEQHDAAEHAKEVGALKLCFDGPVDLYFEPAQLSDAKPGIAGAKFVDIVDVTGKALLRFEKDGQRWLVDPDAIIVFRISKAK